MRKLLACCAMLLLLPLSAGAALPLITDDAGTVGGGKFQIEVSGEFAHDKDSGVTSNAWNLASILTYGLGDKVDAVLIVPYQFISIKDPESRISQNGINDLSLQVKWRFFENDGWSFAVKPGISAPSGDKNRGFGSGSVSGSIFLITSKELTPWGFHLNLGYIRNQNRIDERTDLWHASVASEYALSKTIKAVLNIGIEQNPDRSSSIPPAFILGGLIYKISELIDIDVGVKGGLTRSEPDISVMTGITFHF
jgi:hypothetical protein